MATLDAVSSTTVLKGTLLITPLDCFVGLVCPCCVLTQAHSQMHYETHKHDYLYMDVITGQPRPSSTGTVARRRSTTKPF